MNRDSIGLSVVVWALAALVTVAHATQVIQLTPQELASESVLVVDGKVSGVRSYWNEDRSKIFTETTVAVASTYKGSAPASVRVVQIGGVVGNVRMTAHGALQWKKGEEVLLFLEPATPGTYQVAGFSQGKFLIERDARNGKAFVKHAAPVDAPGATKATASEPIALDQFIDGALSRE
jgi:hypothetical protein